MGKSLQKTNLINLPIGSLDAYITRVNQIPLLSAEEEHGLASRLFYQNDLEAARKLVLPHLRYVAALARNYSGYGLAQADLIQEGNIGLMKAVKRFNPTMGVRLVSFAVHWIKAEIHEFILRNWRIVKVATTKAQRKLFFNLRRSTKHLGWITEEESKTIAKDLNVAPAEVRLMETRLSAHDEAFEHFVTENDDSSPKAPESYLEDNRYNPEMLLESNDWKDNREQRLADALIQLDERSREILRQRWLAEKKATLHELAAHYHISAERVRQIEKLAMDKLKAVLQKD